MKVRFWGVRGSIPVPGAQTARWGGNSSCVEVSHGDATVVLDCGTGARKLGNSLFSRPGRQIEILFTHFHIDHLIGFPFFGPIWAPSFNIRVTIPAFTDEEAQDRVGRFMNGVYFPVRVRELPSTIRFEAVQPGRPFERGPFSVTGVRLNHPGGSVGYRITVGERTVLYLTDTAPLAKPGEGAAAGEDPPALERLVIEAMSEADVVIFDTMFSFDEYLEKMTWGHAYPEYAVALAKAARVKHLVLFHHAPDATDEDLDALEARWKEHASPRVTLAAEGLELDLDAADGQG